MAEKKYNDIPVKNNMNVETVTEVIEVKKEFTKVITSEPKKVKRGLVSRLFRGVVGPEGASGIGEYVTEEIIKPAVKNLIVDAITSGVNMIMYGNRGPRRTNGYNDGYHRAYGTSAQRSYTDYRERSTSTSHSERHEQPDTTRRRSDRVEEYILETRMDASQVLTALLDSADRYGSVSLADYYDLIGVSSLQYTDNQYGWRASTLNRATIIPMKGGHTIRFPDLEVI